ncbi:hypothetical protein GCM10009836_48960 [Pseudonocardia ailaonensis]|uniref:Stress-response A/B barrel domain-containing protein n=1 Tax=Pseudonocardia ailaonensis TaxID=367279 RepID=A0ABN2NDK1_9PSEU
MFKRTYPIRLRKDVSPEEVAGLETVLAGAATHIPGFLESRLAVEQSASPGSPDLVWENVFEDEDAFWLYGGHPYHMNLINDCLSFESPNTVLGQRSQPTTWSDEENVTAEQLSEARRRSEPGTSTDLSPGYRALERAGLEVPVVHLLEQIDVAPGKTGDYLDAVRTIFVPGAASHGMTLLASWKSPPQTGEEELYFLWSVNGWGEAFRNFVEMISDTDLMPRWLDAVRPLRTGGRRRYLVPSGLSGEWSTSD